MSHSLDLEGIADDGFGYTVKVSAPGRTQQAPPNRMWRVPKMSFRGKHMEMSDERAAKDALAIPIMTELNVAESWKVPVEKE
jgi:hypothetical protein